MPGTARILSIDGGGIRGIIPARLLQRIEERVGTPIADLFHLVAGTSTGGILAAGLTAPGPGGRPLLSAEDLVRLYRERGGEIFDRSFWHGFGSLGGTVDEKYEADGLEEVLADTVHDLRLSQARTEVLITAYDIERRKPHFFKSWQARGERLAPGETAAENEFLLRDVARATSAAPTYFEPALLQGGGKRFALVDGGVFANNPAMCAMASARELFPDASRFLIVSLGTGVTERPIPYDDAKDWGLVGWARPILNVVFDGVSDTVDYQLMQVFNRPGGIPQYYRFQIDLGGQPDDPDAPNDDFDDARPENIRALEAKADDLLRQEARALTRVVNQLRRRPRDPVDGLRGAVA